MDQRVKLIVCFFLLQGLVSCEKRSLNHEEHCNEKTEYMKIPVGTIHEICLISAPSLGFKWMWSNKSAQAVIDSTSKSFEPVNGLKDGEGIETWRFQAKKRGNDTIRLDYFDATGAYLKTKLIYYTIN